MPNGDLSEMKHERRREAPVSAAGMLYGPKDLAVAMKELGIAPAEKNKLTVAAVVLAALSPVITVLGGGYFMANYWRGEDARKDAAATLAADMTAARKEREDLRNEVDRVKGRTDIIEKDRAGRIVGWEARMVEVEKAARRLDLIEDAVTRQGKSIEAVADKLATGREDRVRDINNLTEAQTGIRLELNGVKVELGFIRRALEARGGTGAPFGGENQMWRGPPYPPLLKVRRELADREG